MLGLNRNQYLGVAVIVVAALMASSAQLDVLFGSTISGMIVAFCIIANLILGGIVTMITGQTGMASQLQNLKGVSLQIDKTADPSLAKLAVDPRFDNIAPVPGQEQAVAKIATQ